MTADWPPPKKLPPGYPLPSVDKEGRAIQVGAKVRIVSVASCAGGLPREDQIRLSSYVGKVLEVLEIDRYGMLWFAAEGGGKFSLKPGEVAVV
jgi:ferritin-like metal-binding protein YciE